MCLREEESEAQWYFDEYVIWIQDERAEPWRRQEELVRKEQRQGWERKEVFIQEMKQKCDIMLLIEKHFGRAVFRILKGTHKIDAAMPDLILHSDKAGV